MINTEYLLLKDYRKWIGEYEDSDSKLEKLKKKKKNHKSELSKFDKEHIDEFIALDKRIPSTKAKVGLGALTVLTGGLATGLLVNKINKDKHADEWNNSWRERYELRYARERMECLYNDERFMKEIDQEIEKTEAIKSAALKNISTEHEGFMLIDSLRNLDSIDKLLEIFDSGKAYTIEDALKIFYSIDYSKYDIAQGTDHKRDKNREHGWFHRSKSSKKKTWMNES